MHGAQNTCLNACHTPRKKGTCTRACTPINGTETSLPSKLLRTYFESCASIVQAVVCHLPCCYLDEISCLTLVAQENSPNPVAQENSPNPRQLMSPLHCCTSIIRSSALVRTSSSLSMVRTRSLATELIHQRILFSPFSNDLFLTSTMLWYTKPHIVCAFLYVITFAPYFKSSPVCAHLSPSTRKLLFMFWHPILCCPSSYCMPHTIIKCRMTILISIFPCLAARFFPREYCSIRPLAPLFAYLRI